MNLKKTLMELGNRLVTEHGFMPAAHKGYGIPNNFSDPATRTTHLISELTEFINNHDEAREVLTELGVEWPITKQQQKRADDLRTQRIASVDQNGDRPPALMAQSRALDKVERALDNTESLFKEIREYLDNQKTHGKGKRKT